MSDPVAELTAWILRPHPDVTGIDPDHDIIESRLVDSLRFVELVMLVERLGGRPVDIDTLSLNGYRTLRAIAEHHFPDGERAAA